MTANKKPTKKLIAKSRKTEAPLSDEIVLDDVELVEDDISPQPPAAIRPPSTNNSSESHNSSSPQWVLGKNVVIIFTLFATGFGIITGYAWIKEDITKDSKTEIQAIKCAQNEIFKCAINKCSSKELVEKHSECFNK
jgi:hypothetical protein